MRGYKRGCLLVMLLVLLAGCAEKAETSKMTIEPYSLSERESELVRQTGADNLDFYRLNGNLAEDEELRLTIGIFENGEREGDLLATEGWTETEFNQALISFGIRKFSVEEERHFELAIGTPSTLSTIIREDESAFSSATGLLNEKTDLTLGEPVYLAAWRGNRETGKENGFHSIGISPDNLSEGLKEADLAFVYEVLLKKKE